MVRSRRDIIDPRRANLVTYESNIKSGTHGEVYQKQLAQLLLLRLSREEKKFLLAYELTAAEKFDDVVVYDETAKQWVFLQSKHADCRESRIDLNGLLPKTNQDRGDFSLYKYFHSYMVIQSRFIGKVNFLLFTNKKLDEKLRAVGDYITVEDRKLDEYLRLTSAGATHKVLTPTESTIQSIVEYANKDLYALKDAIKLLVTGGIITNELLKYKAYLDDILTEFGNNQVRFKDTFNDSLIFIAELYKVLQPKLHDFTNIDQPSELDVKEMECQHLDCSSMDFQAFEHLADAIETLFRSGIVSDQLKKYDNLLGYVLTTTAHGKLAFKDTFNSDVVPIAELYKLLKAELSDWNREVTMKQKLFDGKDSRSKHHSVLVFAEASDVRQFFALLTLSAHQPDDLEPFIVEELHLWMRKWLRPDVLGKLTENDEKNAVKFLEAYFEATLKRGQGIYKLYLDQSFVTQLCDKMRLRIIELHPELNDVNPLYINRDIIFENQQIHNPESFQAPKTDENHESKLDSSSGRLVSLDCFTSENDLEIDDTISLPNKTCTKMTDRQFAANLKVRFSHYQCLVLTADPGIGKTELLQYVALERQKLSSGGVFLFYLNRIQDSNDASGKDLPLDILKSALSPGNVVRIRNVLENVTDDRITILFDGYDEIHEKNRGRINNLLDMLLKSKHIQLVISVRNHEKKTLRSFFKNHKFNVGYFSLEAFNSENIIEYLAQSWKENVKCDTHSKFNSYSKFLIEKFYGLCRVPLMVKMMAKIYKNRFEQFKQTNLVDKECESSYLEREFLEVEHIYDMFIESCLLVKINDACNGIGKVDQDKHIFGGFYLDHQLLAIEFLDVSELDFVLKNPKYMKKRDCIRRCDKSILVKFVGDRVYFSHHSYAEFFVANFLWEDFVYLKNVVKNVLYDFKGIRRFFIKIIENNFSLFVSEIDQETSFVSKDVVFWACESNAVELLKYALSKRYFLKPKEAKMLQIAIKNGSDKVCSYLIDDRKVHPDVKYDGGLAALHSAVIYGHRNLVHFLLDKGADINIQNREGWSALHYAVHYKRNAITKLLIEKGINVDSLNKNKWNVLHMACNNGDAEMAKILIQKGARLDSKTSEGETALDLAATRGCTEVVNILIENLSKMFPLCNVICRAFQAAVRNGHQSMKEILINKFLQLAGEIDIDEMLIHITTRERLMKKLKSLTTWSDHRLIVELLLDKDANVNAVDEYRSPPFFLTSQNGHKEAVETLYRGGVNVDALTSSNWTALHENASKGHCDNVELLLDKGANVNAVDENNITPLFLACQNGHNEVVKTLMRRGANIDVFGNWTALHISASKGHSGIVDSLLGKGANVNAVSVNNITPLYLASQNNHIQVVETLLRRGANIDALTYDKWTALHASACKGYYNIVNLLLENGINVNAVDKEGVSPLYLACQNGHTEIVETLLRRGANIAALTHNKWTGLHTSAFKGHCDIVNLLLDKNADVNAVAEDGVSSLYLASLNGHKEVVETLVKKGANIEALTRKKWTALHTSASNGHCSIVDFLLDKDAQVNAAGVNNVTPLYLACQNGHKEVVETLTNRGADIGILTNNKWTALHVAASNGHRVVVDLLLEKGAVFNAVDINDHTPLSLAMEKGHQDVVQSLFRWSNCMTETMEFSLTYLLLPLLFLFLGLLIGSRSCTT